MNAIFRRPLRQIILVVFVLLSTIASASLVMTDKLRLPNFVIEDSASNIVGAIVGYEGFLPLVLAGDVMNQGLIRVSKNNLATKHRVFYSGNDCTGTAYLPSFEVGTTSNAAGSFDEISGVVFGIGKPIGSGALGVLYKSTGVISTPTTIDSAWISSNTPPNCFVNSNPSGQSKFQVEIVQDLDAAFTPPFVLQ